MSEYDVLLSQYKIAVEGNDVELIEYLEDKMLEIEVKSGV